MTFRAFLCFFAIVMAHPLSAADWMRAETDNYIVHAKLSETELSKLAVLMEEFNRLLKNQLPGQTEPGRKFHIYLDQTNRRISRTFGMNVSGSGRNVPEISANFSVYDPSVEPLFRNFSLFFAQANFHIENAFFAPIPPGSQPVCRSFSPPLM